MAPKIVLKKSAAALKTAAAVANTEMEKKLAEAVKMPMAAQTSTASGEQKEEVPMEKKLVEASEEQKEEVPMEKELVEASEEQKEEVPMEKELVEASEEQKEEVPMEKKLVEASEEQKEEVPTGVEVEVKTKAKNRKRKINRESYKCYIFRVLKEVHPDVGISIKAIAIMDSFINDFFDKLVNEACKLAKYAKKNTVTSREIQAAAKLILPEELSKHAAWQGNAAVAKFLA